MMFNVEYKVRRIVRTNCCTRVYYVTQKELMEAESEAEAIQKVSTRPEVVTARIL